MRHPTHPGKMLHHLLKNKQISQRQFSQKINKSNRHISNLISGKDRITVDTALRLEKATGIAALIWIRHQATYDIWKAGEARYRNIPKVV